MQRLRVFLSNAILSIPILLGALPVIAPSTALCPSYPLTAWLAPDRWVKPNYRWGVAPLVAGVVGYRGWFGTLAPAILACTGLLLVILTGVRLAGARAVSPTQRED